MSAPPLPPRQDTSTPTPSISSSSKDTKSRTMGLTAATGLVAGSVVGTGVFTMPAVLAGAGTVGIVVLVVVAAGAMLLASLFGTLTNRIPHADGGLYA